jgi:hypothetical protein
LFWLYFYLVQQGAWMQYSLSDRAPPFLPAFHSLAPFPGRKRAWGNYTVTGDQGRGCNDLKRRGHEMNFSMRAYEIKSVLCEYEQKVLKFSF